MECYKIEVQNALFFAYLTLRLTLHNVSVIVNVAIQISVKINISCHSISLFILANHRQVLSACVSFFAINMRMRIRRERRTPRMTNGVRTDLVRLRCL